MGGERERERESKCNTVRERLNATLCERESKCSTVRESLNVTLCESPNVALSERAREYKCNSE